MNKFAGSAMPAESKCSLGTGPEVEFGRMDSSQPWVKVTQQPLSARELMYVR